MSSLRSARQGPVLGIDIGGTGLKLGLVRLGESPGVSSIEILRGHSDQDPLEAIDRLVEAADTLLATEKLDVPDLLAIGVGCAGLVDTSSGILRTSPNLPTWRDVPLRAAIEERFGRKIGFVNDAAAFLEAEWRHGAARDAENAIFITLGTGVGGGLVLDGRPFRGAGGLGAEIGHMSIDRNGPDCPCGNRGCLELFVGRTAIESAARAAGFPEGETSPVRLSFRADSGHEKAIGIFEEIGRRLGLAVAGLVNLLEPEVVVVGGGIAGSSHLILPAAQTEMEARSMVARQRKIPLRPAHFGPAAGIIGAALLALADE